MPWNLFIFPLVAGYYLLTRSYFFKYKQIRLDRQRLIFETVLWGTLIGFLIFSFRYALEFCFPEFFTQISQALPLKAPYTFTSFLCLPFTIAVTKILNHFIENNKEEYLEKAITDIGNSFEKFLKNAFVNEKLLLFTLNSGKCYVGWINRLPIPSFSKYVKIIPAISGFRNEDKELIFTSDYISLYQKYRADNRLNEIENNVEIIIEISDISTVSHFDLQLYEKFNKVEE